MKKLIKIGFILYLTYSLFQLFNNDREISHGPGVIAPKIPIQKDLKKKIPFEHKDYQINPLAFFKLEARVLHKKRYRFGREAELSPLDLALGWGPMSDEKILDEFRIRQSNRFYYWYSKNLPISKMDVIENSSNMHLIPENEQVWKK